MKTTWKREVVDQQARVIVEPSADFRVVRILFPQSPDVGVGIDSKGEDIAFSRLYDWPVAPKDRFVKIPLEPGQFISAAAASGFAVLSVLIYSRTE